MVCPLWGFPLDSREDYIYQYYTCSRNCYYVYFNGDGKSYIYANYNPKYAQYVLTIFRTIYNFCLPQGGSRDKKQTPAMKLGIANKVYDLKEIIYFR